MTVCRVRRGRGSLAGRGAVCCRRRHAHGAERLHHNLHRWAVSTEDLDTLATATLKINVTDSPPNPRLPTVYYDGHYYSVNDTVWDRTTFLILSILFQTTIGRVENVGIPITISK